MFLFRCGYSCMIDFFFSGVNLLIGTENGLMLLDRSGQGKGSIFMFIFVNLQYNTLIPTCLWDYIFYLIGVLWDSQEFLFLSFKIWGNSCLIGILWDCQEFLFLSLKIWRNAYFHFFTIFTNLIIYSLGISHSFCFQMEFSATKYLLRK